MGNIKELTIHLKQLFIEAFGKICNLKLKFKLAIFITKGNQLTGVLKNVFFYLLAMLEEREIFFINVIFIIEKTIIAHKSCNAGQINDFFFLT